MAAEDTKFRWGSLPPCKPEMMFEVSGASDGHGLSSFGTSRPPRDSYGRKEGSGQGSGERSSCQGSGQGSGEGSSCQGSGERSGQGSGEGSSCILPHTPEIKMANEGIDQTNSTVSECSKDNTSRVQLDQETGTTLNRDMLDHTKSEMVVAGPTPTPSPSEDPSLSSPTTLTAADLSADISSRGQTQNLGSGKTLNCDMVINSSTKAQMDVESDGPNLASAYRASSTDNSNRGPVHQRSGETWETDTRWTMLNAVSNTDAHFKHQQRGDPDLTVEEKFQIAADVLDKTPGAFLARYGRYLSARELDYFTRLPADYEVSYYLKDLRKHQGVCE
jgi:hypothetical protein